MNPDKSTQNKILNISIITVSALLAVVVVLLVFHLIRLFYKPQSPAVSEPQAQEFTSGKVELNMGESEFSGNLEKKENGNFLLSFAAPQEISGLTMEFSPESNSCTVTYHGISMSLGAEGVGNKAAASVLGAVLSKVLPDAAANGEISGVLGEDEFILTFGKDGLPKQFTMPSRGIDCRFSADTEQISAE